MDDDKDPFLAEDEETTEDPLEDDMPDLGDDMWSDDIEE